MFHKITFRKVKKGERSTVIYYTFSINAVMSEFTEGDVAVISVRVTPIQSSALYTY